MSSVAVAAVARLSMASAVILGVSTAYGRLEDERLGRFLFAETGFQSDEDTGTKVLSRYPLESRVRGDKPSTTGVLDA